MEAETLALAQQIDFSLWGLFARATLMVKLVMIVLIIASFWSWSIIVQKLIQYRAAKSEATQFDRVRRAAGWSV
jgi:biopolymer transport protein TolQ